MSVRDCTALDPALCQYPEFALAGVVDDEDDPSEVTLYPAGADEAMLATRWLTVDADVAVELEATR